MSEGPESAPPLMALVFGNWAPVEYKANLVSYFDPVIPQIFGGKILLLLGVHRHCLVKNPTPPLASPMRKRVHAMK
jgi:hypothetical protein